MDLDLNPNCVKLFNPDLGLKIPLFDFGNRSMGSNHLFSKVYKFPTNHTNLYSSLSHSLIVIYPSYLPKDRSLDLDRRLV